MSNLNRITLIGHIGEKPEQHEFESGAKITKFKLAVNRWDKKDKKDVTDWFDVETFSKLGDYLDKGIKVCVDGQLITNTYKNKDDKFVKKYIVQARTIEILTKKENSENKKDEFAQEKVIEDNYSEPDNYPEDLIDDEEIPFN